MKFIIIVLFIAMFAKNLRADPLNAMDAIVVEQADGSFVSSPFHVRYGKSDLMGSLTTNVSFFCHFSPYFVKFFFQSLNYGMISHFFFYEKIKRKNRLISK